MGGRAKGKKLSLGQQANLIHHFSAFQVLPQEVNDLWVCFHPSRPVMMRLNIPLDQKAGSVTKRAAVKSW
jgi:hypothetical protein